MAKWSCLPPEHPLTPYTRPMNKITFDSNGIYASNPMLARIAMECIEQERRQRACRAAMHDQDLDGGQWGIWNISDRH